MSEINWQEVIWAARNIFPGHPGDPRYSDATVIVVGAEMMKRGTLTDAQLNQIIEATRNFVNKSAEMVDSSIKDSSKAESIGELVPPKDKDDIYRPKDNSGTSLGEWDPPKDPNDIFRLKDGNNSSLGEWDPPKGPDDIFRLKDDKDKNDDKGKKDEEKKPEEVKDEVEEEDEEDDDAEEEVAENEQGDEGNNGPGPATTPAPDGEDDYMGAPRFMPSATGPGEKDPFDVSDLTQLMRLFGDNDAAVDAWDNYDGVGVVRKFWGGDEPIPAWEKIGPKF